MAETVNGVKLRVELVVDVTGPYDGARQQKTFTYERNWTDGTGTNQCGQVFLDADRSTATSEDFDLNGSTNTDAFGQALAMAQLGLVYLRNKDTTTGRTLTLSRPASAGVTGLFAAASDAAIVQPDGLLLWVAPGPDKATSTATTADLLNLAAANAATTYDIVLIGDNS